RIGCRPGAPACCSRGRASTSPTTAARTTRRRPRRIPPAAAPRRPRRSPTPARNPRAARRPAGIERAAVPGILLILEEHAPRTSARWSAGRVRLNARPDALLADADAGRLALGRFSGLGPGAPAVDLIVAADRESAPGWPGGDPESDRFLALARSCG